MESKELAKRFFEYLDKTDKKEALTDGQKKQAAYALNMCTVSVSQIIDYDDINILEQEYEAILNNINLEHMPKDEALLDILKQLLDTITYFRIQEGDKLMIEKEYQHKMKNAIWSAVPNFGLIVAGGNPLTMAISLASQVGIGYMNYRRNKTEYAFAKEKQNWQLQRTAIEQFNGLRRELFNTAWRLADTYSFNDKYRLTEKQIKQYNQILIDTDEIRKYERLESIKDNFEAYPPFWYFIGNAANYIAGNKNIAISDLTRKSYREKALKYFEKYEEINTLNLLREDQIASSCYLEHIDLLLLEKNPDIKKIKNLLNKVIEVPGNSNDILELCAITYLKINEQDSAAKYLRILVNEDYNRIINAQLLSSIYVRKHDLEDYELLATRVDSEYLYPMPKDGEENADALEEAFGKKLKSVLKSKYEIVFEELLQKYSVEWNKLTSVFDSTINYDDDFFLDTPKANSVRKECARQILSEENKRRYYSERVKETNWQLGILDIMNRLCDGLFNFTPFKNPQLIEEAKDEIKKQLLDKKNDINDLQNTMSEGNFGFDSYNFSQTISLRSIVARTFRALNRYVESLVDKANINEISVMEADLRKFCVSQKIEEPEISINNSSVENSFGNSNEIFSAELFGHKAVVARKNVKFLSDMAEFVKEQMKKISLKDDSLSIYFAGEPEFNSVFYDTGFESKPSLQSHAIMILKDNSKERTDLIFTTNGIVHTVKGKIKYLTPYKEVELNGKQIILYKNFKYSTTALDMHLLFNVIRNASKFVVGIEDKTEYTTGVLTSDLLVKWFKTHSDSLGDGVTRIIAIPSKDLFSHLGYKLDVELDDEKTLMQFYYDTETGDLIDFRVIHYESIDSNFQAKLLDAKGFLKIK